MMRAASWEPSSIGRWSRLSLPLPKREVASPQRRAAETDLARSRYAGRPRRKLRWGATSPAAPSFHSQNMISRARCMAPSSDSGAFGDVSVSGEAESTIDRIGADVRILREYERPIVGGRQVLANPDLVDTRASPIHLPQLHDASSAKRGSSMRWACCSRILSSGTSFSDMVVVEAGFDRS
jgi:hypothetical protein